MAVLTGQSQDNGAAWPLLDQVRPGWWLSIDPDPGFAQQCKAAGINLIARYYHQDYDAGSPESVGSPADYVAFCASHPSFNEVEFVTSPNEPHGTSAEWLAGVVAGMAALGKECIVGNWGTGWDGFYVPGARFFSCHEYGYPEVLSQRGYQALRYRNWFPSVQAQNPSAHLFITEAGITQAVTGGPDVGWRTTGSDGSAYAHSLAEYAAEVAQDGYVVAIFVFLYGGWYGGGTFDGLGDPALTTLIGGGDGGLIPAGTFPVGAAGSGGDGAGGATTTYEEGAMSRTPEQQTLIDVLNGWSGRSNNPGNLRELASRLGAAKVTAAQRMNLAGQVAQAARELTTEAEVLEGLFPLA